MVGDTEIDGNVEIFGLWVEKGHSRGVDTMTEGGTFFGSHAVLIVSFFQVIGV